MLGKRKFSLFVPCQIENEMKDKIKKTEDLWRCKVLLKADEWVEI